MILSAVSALLSTSQAAADDDAGVRITPRQDKSRLPVRGTPNIYVGDKTVWASSFGKELFAFEATGKVNEKYNQAWFPKRQGTSGYLVKFVIEQEGQLWFGGSPWRRFKSTGFYRVDKQTGEFFMYGPRDGFKLSATYETYDAVPVAGRLWLATSAGLAQVDPRRLRD